MFGDEINNIEDKVVRTVEGAKKAGSIVLLKGSDTVIAPLGLSDTGILHEADLFLAE